MQSRTYFKLLRKWLWLLLLATAVAAGAGLTITLQLEPQYAANITLLVDQSAASRANYDSVLAGQQLAQTYAQLIQQRPVLEQAISDLHLGLTPDALAKSITVKVVPNTQLVQASVRSNDPAAAAAIANELATVFIRQNDDRRQGAVQSSSQYLSDQLNSLEAQVADSQKRISELQLGPKSADQAAQLAAEQTRLANLQSSYSTVLKNMQDIRIAEASVAGSTTIVQPAVVPTSPVSPRIPINVAMSGLAGLLVALAGVALIEHLDDKVNSPERIREAAGLPTLGCLYVIAGKERGPARLESHSADAEAYRMLRTNLEFCAIERPWRTLLVTSASPSEGKTTVASSLATMLAGAGKSVLLADMDLRRPGIGEQFDIAGSGGLTNLLLDPQADLDRYMAACHVPGLCLLPTGPIPPNPSELLSSQGMTHLLQRFAAEFDAVVIDSPPVLAVTDPVILATRCDATLLVVNGSHTRMHQVRTAHETLRNVGANIVGAALNRMASSETGGYYQYYYYSGSGNGNGNSPNGHKQASHPRQMASR